MELCNRTSVRSDPRPQVSTFLGDRPRDGGPLHLPLVVHDHSSVILKIDELPVLPSHLLPLLWLSFLDCGKNHVSTASSWESVEATSDPINSNHIQVLTSCVVCAVHDSPHWAGKGDPELGSCGSSTSSFRH